MGIVNLLASDVWTEADIVAYTEAMLRSGFPQAQQDILSRKMIGFSMGRIIPTAAEQADLMRFEQLAYEAQAAGRQARADMALLQGALDVEAGVRTLTDAPPEVAALVAQRAAPVLPADEPAPMELPHEQ